MMTAFAQAGFDVWTMDHEAYGKSERTDGNSDIASGVDDLKAAVEVVKRETVPAGIYLDMTSKLPVVFPERIASPVLVVRGEYDGIATMEDLLDFFVKLPNGDRQFSVIAGAAHALATCKARFAFWCAAETFLKMPARPVQGPLSTGLSSMPSPASIARACGPAAWMPITDALNASSTAAPNKTRCIQTTKRRANGEAVCMKDPATAIRGMNGILLLAAKTNPLKV